MQINGLRTLTSALNEDRSAAALGATNKMFWSEYHRDVMELAIDILGMEGQILTGGDDDADDEMVPGAGMRHPRPGLPGRARCRRASSSPGRRRSGAGRRRSSATSSPNGCWVSRRSRSWSTRRGRQAETTSRPAPRRTRSPARGASRDRGARCSLRRERRRPAQARMGSAPGPSRRSGQRPAVDRRERARRLPRHLRLPARPGRAVRHGAPVGTPPRRLLLPVRSGDDRGARPAACPRRCSSWTEPTRPVPASPDRSEARSSTPSTA